MDIKREVCPLTNRRHHQGANGYLRDKTPVHHIYMNIISPCLGDFSNLLAQPTEIGGENRRGKLDLRVTSHP
jgi:hypothetical protein